MLLPTGFHGNVKYAPGNAHVRGLFSSLESMAEPRVETKLLDGKALAAQVRKQVAEEVKALKEANFPLKPKLVIVQVRYTPRCNL